jgi:hypothetical protein
MKNYISFIMRHKLWLPAVWSVVAILIIAIYFSLSAIPQASTINGNYVRDDSRPFHRFIKGIKEHKGILILGTSETANNLDNLNYPSVLNRDKSTSVTFSKMAGAGRDYSMYFPLLLNDPELFQGIEILIYVNPTYWREDLNGFNNDYFTRYVGPEVAIAARDRAKEKGIYDDFIKPARYGSISIDSLKPSSDQTLRKIVEDFRSVFFYDLQQQFSWKQVTKDIDLRKPESDFAYLKKDINTEYNVSESYLREAPDFPDVNPLMLYRYKALYEFINLCQENGIRPTFYLGPYNAIYCGKKNPDMLTNYDDVLRKIRMIISSSGMPLIDGTAQGQIPGTFIDIQHLSKYGTYLTAKQIKAYYEKMD